MTITVITEGITEATEDITDMDMETEMSTATMVPVSTTTLNTANLGSEATEEMTAMIVMVAGVVAVMDVEKAEEKVVEGLGITVRGPTLE